MSESPLNPVGTDRDTGGRFAPGNKAAKGNPLNRRAQLIRASLLRASTKEAVTEIAAKLIAGARTGDLAYIREYLDRTIGRPPTGDMTDRIARLEQTINELIAQQKKVKQ